MVGMPEFFTEGVAELVMGLDDYDGQNKEDILSLANNREQLKNAMALASGTGTSIRYSFGYMFLRYLCQQGLDSQSEDSQIYTSTAQEALSNIDDKGKDYAMNLVMGAMSGHAPQTLPQ